MSIATQSTSEYTINQLNLAMRQTPWYQEWFAQRRLNPNQVKLNDQQRADLTRVAAANGYQLGDRMKIDQAGNINQKGGFAGMPTWAKVAIASAPIAGAMLVPGVREATIGQLGGIFGGGASAGGGAATSTGVATGSTIGSIAGVTGPTAAGIGLSDVLMASVGPGINFGTSYLSNRANANAARDAANASTSAANYAADLEAKATDEQLAFLRENEARRRLEWDTVQKQNQANYTDERDYDRRLYDERQARLEPYRRFAVGTLGYLSRPLRNVPQAGSIGARMGRV